MRSKRKITVALLEAFIAGKLTKEAVYKIAKCLNLKGFSGVKA
jgi:hypothetical protein